MRNNILKYGLFMTIVIVACVMAYQFFPVFSFISLAKDNTPKAAAPTSLPSVTKQEDGTPKSIVIPAIHINSHIVTSVWRNGSWQALDNVVSFSSDGTASYGDFNNTKSAMILFGHRKDVFGLLPELKKGSEIILSNANVRRNYEVVTSQYVNFADNSVLNTSFDNELILYTCDFFADEKRLVIIAKLK